MAEEDKSSSSRILELRKNLREEITKREKAESEKTLLEKQFKEKEKKLKLIKTDKTTFEEQNRELVKNVEGLEKDKRDNESKRSKKKLKIKNLRDENQSLNKQLKLLKKNLEKVEEEKKLVERKMRRRSSVLSEELENMSEQTQQLREIHNKKMEELASENISLVQQKANRTDQDDSISVLLNKERDRVEALESEKKEQDKKIRDLTKKIDELETENNLLKANVKALNDKSNQKIQKLEGKVGGLSDKVKSLQDLSDVLEKKATDAEIKKNEQILEKLNEPEQQLAGSFERKSSTIEFENANPTRDDKFDENKLKQPGSERAKLWEYHPASERWDDGKWSVSPIVISMEKRPFAEGSLRTAYKTKNLDQPDKLFVSKISKNRAHGREIYENDVEMQMFCLRWAERYNLENPPKKVSFTSAYLLELIDRPRSPVATLEMFIDGEYKKYSNNDGKTSYDRNTPQAFSHFTYERSNHDWVIVDIQGVEDDYTDPQVHTKDHKGFGIGNLGQKGIVKFVITHQCNAICKYLKLPSTQEKYGKINEIRMDKGTMPFPRDLIKLIDASGGAKILDEAEESKVDFASFKCVETIKGEKVGAICANYKNLFVGSGSNINLYKLGSFELQTTLKGHTDPVESLCFNDELLFSGSADKDIRVWDLDTFKCIKILTDHTSNVKALVVDSGRLYSGSHDKTIRMWSLKDYSCEGVLHGHEKFVKALALSKDSKVLFSGGNDNIIKMWDLQTKECVYNFDSHTKWIKSIHTSGQYVFSGANDKRIKIWNMKTLDLVTTFKPHTDKINTVLATPDFLVSASEDSNVKIFDYKTLQCVNTLSEHKGSVVSLCCNEKYLVTASFDGIKVWTWSKK